MRMGHGHGQYERHCSAVLTDTACIILAEGTPLDDNGMAKARQQGVTVLQSKQPVFETALLVHELIHA